MKPFCFQKFEVQQNKSVFRVGTDAVLLGSLSEVAFAEQILEIGSGTGIVSLMLAQRNALANILAIDIDPEATQLTHSNFSNSIFSDRLKAICSDVKSFDSKPCFDLIISNPPYFEVNDSDKDVFARQKLELNFLDLICAAKRLLTNDGLFVVIIPESESDDFINLSSSNNLFLNRKINIRGIENGPVKRAVLEFSFTNQKVVYDELVVESSPRQYSQHYLELTKDFHVFKTKKL